MAEMTKEEQEEFKRSTEKALKRGSVTRVPKFKFEDRNMTVSDVGYGKDEYKSSKPNIVKEDAIIEEIKNISAAADTAIGHTIGPYANETLIQTNMNSAVPVYNTRDGYTILNQMSFTQVIPQAIFKIIRETSNYLQEHIGDSTSSGIPIQNTLIENYVSIFNDSKAGGKWKYSPVGIKNISEICVNEIINGFRDNPLYQKIFPVLAEGQTRYNKEDEDEIIKWLTKVATIASNNDYETGKKIAELYRDKLDGRGDVIAITSKTSEEYIEETKAYVVGQGLLDYRKMSNTVDGLTCEFDDPLIAMFDGRIRPTDLKGFKKIVEVAAFGFKKPILVLAASCDAVIGKYMNDCLTGLQYNIAGEELSDPKRDQSLAPCKIEIACVYLQNTEILDQMSFDDTVLMTNSVPFSTELHIITDLPQDMPTRMKAAEGFFGHCEKMSSGYSETLFVGCTPNLEKFDRIIKELEEKLARVRKVKFHVTDYNEGDILQRLNRLECKTTYYYCGGKSDNVKYSRKLGIEDAIMAVKSAIINGGVSIGGNMCVTHYIEHNIDDLTERVLNDIASLNINITAAQNQETLEDIVYSILEAIENSFGQAYRYALNNMYRDSKQSYDKWKECIMSKVPTIYNIMTDRAETFNGDNIDECTTLLVPRRTDECLLEIITETVSELINIGNMITIISPGMDLEAVQLEQLKNGSIYAQHNSISAMH